MKQNLLGVAVFVFVVSIAAAPFANAEFKIGAEARVRGEGTNNVDLNSGINDENRFVASRFRLNVGFDAGSGVTALFQPQFTKTWAAPDAFRNTGTSGGLNDTSNVLYSIHQGYLGYQMSKTFSLVIGRQELVYGDHLVIGNVGWSNIGRSFDAIKLRSSFGPATVDLLWSILAETADTVGDKDDDLIGVYSSFDLGEYLKNADLYVLNRHQGATTTTNDTLTAVGARLKSTIADSIHYRTEFTFERVKTAGNSTSENQFDIELGYTVIPDLKLKVFGEYFRATKNYDQLYPTAHKWLGIADYFGRRNIMGFNFGVAADPIENLSFETRFHLFSRTDTSVAAYKLNGTTGYGTNGTDGAIGNELDLIVNYKLTQALVLEAGGALLMPGAYLKANLGPNSGYFYYAQLTSQF